MREYRVLNINKFENKNFSILPIRKEDRFLIMKWRNEQIYHLRQNKPLTKKDQNEYFDRVISSLFSEAEPDQLLFSFLKDEICVGYGGLVHINWIDKNAEISFVINTDEETNYFENYWGIFLGLIERVAFEELELHKLFVYAFDLRPHLYQAIEKNDYKKEATLKDHCFFEGNYIDVIIHSKINKK